MWTVRRSMTSSAGSRQDGELHGLAACCEAREQLRKDPDARSVPGCRRPRPLGEPLPRPGCRRGAAWPSSIPAVFLARGARPAMLARRSAFLPYCGDRAERLLWIAMWHEGRLLATGPVECYLIGYIERRAAARLDLRMYRQTGERLRGAYFVRDKAALRPGSSIARKRQAALWASGPAASAAVTVVAHGRCLPLRLPESLGRSLWPGRGDAVYRRRLPTSSWASPAYCRGGGGYPGQRPPSWSGPSNFWTSPTACTRGASPRRSAADRKL